MKKHLGLAAAICFLVVVFSGCKEKQKNFSELKIACNLPMTGDLGFYGQYVKDGVNMAMEELKDSLGYNNINMIYDFKDNQGTPKNALTVYNKQLIDGFDIYMSGVTAQTLAIADKVNLTNQPHFIWSFFPLQLKENENYFRTWIDMAYEAECYIKYIDAYKPHTIAFVYQNLSSTYEIFNDILEPYVKSKGISIVYNESYDINTQNFRDINTKIKQANPDIIIVYGFQNHLAELIKGFNSNKLKKDGNILCSFDFLDVKNILEPELLDGIVTNVPQFVIDNTSHVNAWRNKFELRYKREPQYTDAYAYDFAYIMYNALLLQKSNPNIPLKDHIFSIKEQGVTGQLFFNKNGQLNNNIKTCIFKNGKFENIHNIKQ